MGSGWLGVVVAFVILAVVGQDTTREICVAVKYNVMK